MDPRWKPIELSDAAVRRSLLVLFETHCVAVRSRSLESSETVSDVTCTIHPYYFSGTWLDDHYDEVCAGALDPDGTS